MSTKINSSEYLVMLLTNYSFHFEQVLDDPSYPTSHGHKIAPIGKKYSQWLASRGTLRNWMVLVRYYRGWKFTLGPELLRFADMQVTDILALLKPPPKGMVFRRFENTKEMASKRGVGLAFEKLFHAFIVK